MEFIFGVIFETFRQYLSQFGFLSFGQLPIAAIRLRCIFRLILFLAPRVQYPKIVSNRNYSIFSTEIINRFSHQSAHIPATASMDTQATNVRQIGTTAIRVLVKMVPHALMESPNTIAAVQADSRVNMHFGFAYGYLSAWC